MPKAAAPACSVALTGAARTPRVEKKFVKSMVGPVMPELAPPTQSIWATFLPARSAAAASVSACRAPRAENDVRLLKAPSPIRWYVLFVEPCSLGHVPVIIVYQPTPVFGGKPGSMPLSPRTPLAMRLAYVGMTPSAAYFSMRSGRMPSEAKKSALEASGAEDCPCFASRGLTTITATSESSSAPSTAMLRPCRVLMTRASGRNDSRRLIQRPWYRE